MDPEKNRIPEDVKRIHLIAVCGTAMGALACMLKELGYEVTGSDQKVYPPMSDFLREKGVVIADGFHADHLAYGPDLVVVGNAVSRDNAEARAVAAMGLPYCSMPQALNHFGVADKQSVLITGTHGKTTTSALMAWVLFRAGLDPTYMIGGIVKNFNSNYRIGQGPYVVIEGDEYDTAFFDKGAKFMHYSPRLTILTSVEFDHADIFTDFEHVRRTFERFIGGLSSRSDLVAWGDDPTVVAVSGRTSGATALYGTGAGLDYQLRNLRIEPPFSLFDIAEKNGAVIDGFRVPLAGEHNLLNTLAVIVAASKLGVPLETTRAALESFASVKRRQEVRGVKAGITVMDDFAHHPTAVRETIRALKPFYTKGRLIAVFEPRTNSSMRKVFQEVYPASFDQADLICIRKPPLLEKIPAGERFSSEKLAADIAARGKQAHFFDDTGEIIDFVKQEARAGDLVLIMSNGGFDNIHARLLDSL
ncbi:MAG: UDP-N-acetylmuramate:L-alanyl-gamma-D-glutamyl-meso-diaminopimelate ligase [Thermodesulfobacteriota bacterium]